LLTHNCAYAANFALEAAGIKLFDNKPYVFINRIFDIPFFRIPLFCTITPYDLFDRAKYHKLKQLQASNVETEYRVLDFKIKLWCSLNTLTKERNVVAKIQNEVEKRHKRYPEHTEAQIDVLLKTLQLIRHLPSDEECNAYQRSAYQFMKRVPTKTGQLRLYLIILFSLSLGCMVESCFDLGIRRNWKGSERTCVENLGLLLVSSATFFKLPNKINSLGTAGGSVAQPTELSKSMCELVNIRRRR
jgi:hypothetical protein